MGRKLDDLSFGCMYSSAKGDSTLHIEPGSVYKAPERIYVVSAVVSVAQSVAE